MDCGIPLTPVLAPGISVPVPESPNLLPSQSGCSISCLGTISRSPSRAILLVEGEVQASSRRPHIQEPTFLIGPENDGRTVLPFSLATLAHLLALFSLLGASYLAVEPVAPPLPPPDVTFWVVTPRPDDSSRGPEKRTPIPAKGEAATHETSPPTPVPQTPPESPVIETESEIPPPEPESAGYADSGGDAGLGSPGGIPGGIGPEGGGTGGPGSGQGGEAGPMELTPHMSPPVLLVKVEPDYPEVMRRARIPGRVVVEAVIGTDGSVEEAQVLSATNPTFGDAAVQAVRRWRYRPALQSGLPVRVYFRVLFEFVIR